MMRIGDQLSRDYYYNTAGNIDTLSVGNRGHVHTFIPTGHREESLSLDRFRKSGESKN